MIFLLFLEHLIHLERLYLCGTMIDNLWMTVAALKGLSSLQEVAFCKFDNQQLRAMSLEDEDDEDVSEATNEREAESILDLIARRIGDITADELGRINNLGDSLTKKFMNRDWSPLERLSQNLGISNLPARITRLGERLESRELAVFGERLQRLSIPATISYLGSVSKNLASITETKASSIGQLLSTIQTTINRFISFLLYYSNKRILESSFLLFFFFIDFFTILVDLLFENIFCLKC